jgi:translation initiation factor IF-3
MEHLDLGRKILDKLVVDTQQAAQVERDPILEGRIMTLVLAPK